MRLRIAYGIHGYGRGHAVRALAVLPELARRHELLVLAGGEAYKALHADYPVVRIPTFKYQLSRGGRMAACRTLLRAAPKVVDLSVRGPALEMVGEVLEEAAPQVVVSDSEAWTNAAAKRLKIPRISFDHFGVLVYCRWPMGWARRLQNRMEARVYHGLMSGPAERIVIASFYAPPPRREGVRVVGPVLRETVLQATASPGEYLLVYFSNGPIHFTSQVEQALRALDVPVVAYGVGREGTHANLDFRPPSNTRFVADLAGCRAVFATAGNQLICEAMHFRKPMLLLPEDSLEQRLNAAAVQRMGIGMRTSQKKVCPEQLRAFLAGEARCVESFPDAPTDGRAQAVQAIERFAEELAGTGSG